MFKLRSATVICGLSLTVSACSAPVTSESIANEQSPATPTAALSACSDPYQASSLVEIWDMALEDKDTGFAAMPVEGFAEGVDMLVDQSEEAAPCLGLDEVLELQRAANDLLESVEVETFVDYEYENVADAGNAWLDAIRVEEQGKSLEFLSE